MDLPHLSDEMVKGQNPLWWAHQKQLVSIPARVMIFVNNYDHKSLTLNFD
jgi:hypothetical protein